MWSPDPQKQHHWRTRKAPPRATQSEPVGNLWGTCGDEVQECALTGFLVFWYILRFTDHGPKRWSQLLHLPHVTELHCHNIYVFPLPEDTLQKEGHRHTQQTKPKMTLGTEFPSTNDSWYLVKSFMVLPSEICMFYF